MVRGDGLRVQSYTPCSIIFGSNDRQLMEQGLRLGYLNPTPSRHFNLERLSARRSDKRRQHVAGLE